MEKDDQLTEQNAPKSYLSLISAKDPLKSASKYWNLRPRKGLRNHLKQFPDIWDEAVERQVTFLTNNTNLQILISKKLIF